MREDWNEISEETLLRIERERKAQQIAMIIAVRDKFQCRYDTANENYQSAGDGRSYSAMLRNENLIDICNLALSALRDGCPNCGRRERNAAANRNKLRQMKDAGVALDYEAVMELLYI